MTRTTKGAECNPDYDGGMICRYKYPGDSACTEYGGKMLCLKKEQKSLPYVNKSLFSLTRQE